MHEPSSTSTSASASGGRSELRRMSSFQPASAVAREMDSSTGVDGSTSSGASGASDATVVQPRPRPLIRGAARTGNTILVNNCQRGNPVLQHMRNIGWEYADIVPDYQVGLSACVLFLSIRYHRLHPEYVHTRVQKLAHMYTLRILLVLCDVTDHQAAIKELTKTCVINKLTLMLAWSAEEAARYLETYKSFELKPPDAIKERVGDDYLSQVTNVLTQVRGINRTDVITLLSTFGSLKNVVNANVHQLAMCPGFALRKASRLNHVFTLPFTPARSHTLSSSIPPPPSSPTHPSTRPIPHTHNLPPHDDGHDHDQLLLAIQLSLSHHSPPHDL